MFNYTICFIRQGDKLLLINRVKAPNMGLWNGVGGKLEPGETLLRGIAREIHEETGLTLSEASIQPAGVVRWVSGSYDSGMYVFYSELPEEQQQLATPLAVSEGILMWHNIAWVLDEQNEGVAHNLKYFLPDVLAGTYNLEHIFTYNDQDQLTDYRAEKLQPYAHTRP